MTPQLPLTSLPKIGPATGKALNKMGIKTVEDLLYNFPLRYLDYRNCLPIKDCKENETVTITGWVKSISARRSFRGKVSLTEAVISDNTGNIKVVWFNQPYLAKTLHKDDELILSGRVERYKTLQLTNPVYERSAEETLHTGRLVPVYRGSTYISNRTVRDLVAKCLPAACELTDIVPDSANHKAGLLSLAESINELHFPTNTELVKRAKYKIAFNDIFPQQLAAFYARAQMEHEQSYALKPDLDLIKDFLATLPFNITASQKRAAWDILQDMEKGTPMNRLLQGDVGSGKTLVALIAALQAANQNLQTAILAPTEILARQHYNTISNYLSNYPHRIGLLTRTFHLINGEEVGKETYLKELKNGTLHISIGTHAQIQTGIQFNNLALIVIDEQHRFGVQQRQYLSTISADKHPHLLSMSATPIPRTLALTMLSNLDISTLSQVPSGRKPILTKIVPDADRTKAYEFINQQIDAGRQAFVITPRVEDDEGSELKSVKAEHKRLSEEVFPNRKVELLHGKMKGTDKEQIMKSFAAKEADILVATSVIEIGIDIPNASVILIEGAERFGLAQLHQLRGRVGRGEHQSYCFLFTTTPTGADNERLGVFSKTLNGFALADLDLQQRGFGDLFGRKQTGYAFRFPEFITIPALKAAGAAAEAVIKEDPELKKHKKLKALATALAEDLHNE